ncbi:MAG TPA: lytic transglycosylase domain-containing protein [Gemmatimonadota bacterium]
MALAIGAAALSVDAETRSGTPSEVAVSRDLRDRPAGNRGPIDPESAGFARRFGVDVDLAVVIHEQAKIAGVEPALVFGLIAAESGFDPWAVGRHGERGLLQIKPSTARAYDRRITPEMLHDPEINVELGLRHLKREVEYFGDPSLGLMSYHMGRARLKRALADGSLPANRYVERVLSSCGRDCA